MVLFLIEEEIVVVWFVVVVDEVGLLVSPVPVLVPVALSLVPLGVTGTEFTGV